MRRTILIFLTFFCTVLFLISPVQALEETEQEQYLSELADTAGKDELQNAVPESAEELLREAGIHDLSIESMLTAPKEIIAMLWKELKRQAMQPVRTFGSVLAALVLCAFLDCIRESFVGGELKELFSGVTVLFLTISVLFPASDCIRDCVRDLDACSSFIAVFAPIYASVTTASGLPVTGNLYS